VSNYRKRPTHSHNPITQSTRLLRELTGRKHALLAGRGAAGICAALRALDLRDQYVLIPSNTCYIVLWAVLRSGNKPLLVDVDLQTANLNIEKIVNHRGHREVKAIIPCHMYGLGAGIREICKWAQERGIYVIEDAALALGATVDGRPAGAWGDVSIFSFGLGKIADNQVGGAILTDDDRLAAEMQKILDEMPLWDDRLMGLTNQWNAIYWALHQYEVDNPRLNDLYPALYGIYGELTAYRLPNDYWDDLPGMLRGLTENHAHRAQMARVYDELNLTPYPPLHSWRGGEIRDKNKLIWTPPRSEGSVLWKYPLLVAPEHRNDLLQYLWDNGVQDATRWYPPLRYMTAALVPDIQQPPTPGADELGASIINLRVDPGVDIAYVQKTVSLIQAYFEEAGI
jgi:dTDP-4-amino-4,6-dideoxygalactose transaminase